MLTRILKSSKYKISTAEYCMIKSPPPWAYSGGGDWAVYSRIKYSIIVFTLDQKDIFLAKLNPNKIFVY